MPKIFPYVVQGVNLNASRETVYLSGTGGWITDKKSARGWRTREAARKYIDVIDGTPACRAGGALVNQLDAVRR